MSDFEFLSITRGKLVLFFSIVASIAFLISLVMILVYACQPKTAGKDPDNEATSVARSEDRVEVTDFMFEEYSLYDRDSKYYLFRPQMKRWNDDQVGKYFTPASEILRDYYAKTNDTIIKGLFDTIQ